MDVRVLGPMQVWEDDHELALGGIRPSALLAMLVLNLGRVVSMSALVDGLWGPEPTANVTNGIHVSVSRLRKTLQCGLPAPSTGGVLRRRRPGYVLELDPEKVDLSRFEALAREGAKTFPINPDVASTVYATALQLWRGPALAEFASLPFAQTEIPRLAEERLNVVVARVQADLVLGRHADLVAELESLVAQHRLHERLHEQLMLSLYRSGRHAEALDVYRRARRTFADELGIEPGRALQELERAVLAQDPQLDCTPPLSLAGSASSAVAGPRGTVAPRTPETPFAVAMLRSAGGKRVWNAPARNPHFTGRTALLDRLHQLLESGPTLAVQALYGLGGVGKTQLVVEYAHRHSDQYDVVWWINSERPALIPEQFVTLATQLGLSTDALAAEVVNRALAELGDRHRWLLIFDNAEQPADVAGFRPRGSGHVLVTSRAPGWGALGGRIEIDVLDRSDTVALLRARIPEMTIETADKLAAELGDLPLAAAQAAGYLEQTGLPSPDYLRRFRTHRAALLSTGDVLDYQGRVDTTWAISLERLHTVNPAAVALLDVSAYLAAAPIPLSILTEHAALLDEPLRDTAADPDALADAVGAMIGFSLARRHRDGYQIHRLLQTVIRNRQSPAQRDRCAATALSVLAAADPGDPNEPAHWADYARLAPHVLAAGPLCDDRPDSRRLLLNTIAYLINTDDYAARSLAAELHQRWQRILGPDHPDTLGAAATLTTALVSLAECDQAEVVGEDALRRACRVLGAEHPITLRLTMNYTFALTLVGRQVELAALEPQPGERAQDSSITLQQALDALGPDHPITLGMTSQRAFALAAASLSDTTSARAECEDALRRAQSRLGQHHPTTLWLTTYLILILVLEGDAEGARILGEQTLNHSRNRLGPDHPISLNSCAVVAFDMARHGDAEQAVALGEDTMERSSRRLGPNHPTTLGAAAAVAIAMERLGASDQAQTPRVDTLARAEGVLGRQHPIARALVRELKVARDI